MTEYDRLIAALKTTGKMEDEQALLKFIQTYAASENMPVGNAIAYLHNIANTWANTYRGALPFVHSAKKQIAGGKMLSDRQLKGILNCMRVDPSGEGRKFSNAPAAAQPAAPAKPATYAVKGEIAFDISMARSGYTQKKNGTLQCIVRDEKGNNYLITRNATGKWAGFTFIAGGVPKDQIDGANPYSLPKVGMQKPDGECMFAANVDLRVVRAMLVREFGAVHIANSKNKAEPVKTQQVVNEHGQIAHMVVEPDPEPVVAEPEPEPEPVNTAPKRKEPVAAEPAAPAKPAGSSIRDLVRQRNGM